MDVKSETQARTVTIVSVVDVVGVLASETFAGSFYLVDNNRMGGSTGEGSDALVTKAKPGDRIVWITMTLECEAFASITAITIAEENRRYCNPRSYVYPNTNVVCWVADIGESAEEVEIPYTISLKLGSRGQPMTTSSSPKVIVQRAEHT
jgi:hypothetical protein